MGRHVVSICPFPDESADVYQIWCQLVQPFDPFPRLLNVWPSPLPRNAPCVIEGRLGFILCSYPHESADVNQSWCQSVQPFDSFPRLFNVWHLKPLKCPLVSRGAICFAYIHSQMDLQMCAKCESNRSSRLTDSPDFGICDTLTPPPPNDTWGIEGRLVFSHVHSQMNPQTWTKVGVNRTASQEFWIVDSLKPPKYPLVSRVANCLAYIHSHMNLHMCAKFGANRPSRRYLFPNLC